jgi:hypothetical protein
MKLLPIGLLLLLTGCAERANLYWHRENTTQVQYEAARKSCERAAMALEHCMQMKGFIMRADR